MTAPTTIYAGGSVALPEGGRTTAVATRAERIVAFGDDALDLRTTPGATTVDLAGGCLLPAFRDGHVHPLWAGVQQLHCMLAGATSVDEVLGRLRTWAAANPERPWIEGVGYDPTILPGGLGRAELLDAALGDDRPALLWASDHHSAWVNRAALAAAGIDDDTPDPADGAIVRDGAGHATGALLEEAAQEVARLLPVPDNATRADALRTALRTMASHGIVWAHDASVPLANLGVYQDVARRGDAACRLAVALRAEPHQWHAQVETFAAERDDDPAAPLAVRTVKFFADGIIEAGTAALLEPYTDNPCSCGISVWEPEELAEAAVAFDAVGFQLHVHAIGDGAVRAALDAVERVVAVNGRRDRRPVIAHTQLVHPDDLPRFAALGVIANFEPLWAQQDPLMTDLTEPRLGSERSHRQYPIGGLAATGTRVSFGSDWPVSSVVPLEGIAVAATRLTRQRTPAGGWLPEHRLPVERALHAYSAGVAHQAFEEDSAGRIEPGARADLCLLPVDPADPSAVAPADLADVPVVATWLGGKEVFRT